MVDCTGKVALGDNFSKQSTKLSFTISKCSSYSSIYLPTNILQDRPWDPNSRWSSGSSTPPQFLILRLEKTAILESITFGKLDKPHVCNVRKFKIFAGLTEENMTELVESGLRNDCYPETFALNHRINGYVFPCRYIKIVPLQSWGPSFNFSIWFVEIHGNDDCDIVQPQIDKFNNFKEREAIRVCLKHLRDHNYLDAFNALQRRTKVQLEHPKVTELHEMLLKGDFVGVEKFLEDCSESHLFHKFIMEQDYKGVWNQILPDSELEPVDESLTTPIKPRMRGGHQMCIDVDTEQIFLFGGWDGHQELADFWSYSIPLGTWTLISENTELEGGPSARSCHRMVLDQDRRQIFTLGRVLDCQFLSRSEMKSDFYVYELDTNKWTLISDDTQAAGGPELIFDHQMCIDSEKSLIYVFGGRILAGTIGISDSLPQPQAQLARDRDEEIVRFPGPLSPSSLTLSPMNSEFNYSGLYSYHIPTDTWTLVRSDISAENKTADTIKSRVGHSMLFHKALRKLYVFAGQRSRECLNDFFSYDVDRDEIEVILDGTKGLGSTDAPSTGFTQRSTIDPELNEIYIFSGSVKDKDKRDDNIQVQNSFWVYDIRRNVWSCVYKNDGLSDSGSKFTEPHPRFAHQLVYDRNTKIHYLFGGNPGRTKEPKLRLDDFWSLKLIRPAKSDVLLECKLMLRKQRFEELVTEDTLAALTYLQTSLSELVNHNDPIQSKEFQKLSHLLFSTSLTSATDDAEDGLRTKEDAVLLKRSQIFDKLVRFFPEDMTQPKVNLIDLLTF